MVHQSRILIALIALACWQNASAAQAWHNATVHSIYSLANGSAVIILNTDSAACTNTEPNKYYYLAIGQNGMTAEGFKNIYASFLTAVSTGATVTINFEDSTPQCYINRMFLRS